MTRTVFVATHGQRGSNRLCRAASDADTCAADGNLAAAASRVWDCDTAACRG